MLILIISFLSINNDLVVQGLKVAVPRQSILQQNEVIITTVDASAHTVTRSSAGFSTVTRWTLALGTEAKKAADTSLSELTNIADTLVNMPGYVRNGPELDQCYQHQDSDVDPCTRMKHNTDCILTKSDRSWSWYRLRWPFCFNVTGNFWSFLTATWSNKHFVSFNSLRLSDT